MKEQKGFASLYAICVLLILSVLGMAAYTAIHKEMKTSRHFVVQSALAAEAQNGILAAASDLREHPEKVTGIGASQEKQIWSGENAEGDIACNVYARKQGENIHLMAQSIKEKQKARIFAQMKLNTHGKYEISRWGAFE